MAEAMVEISLKHFDELTRDSKLLSCLEASGVDNWVGYYEALEDYNAQIHGD